MAVTPRQLQARVDEGTAALKKCILSDSDFSQKLAKCLGNQVLPPQEFYQMKSLNDVEFSGVRAHSLGVHGLYVVATVFHREPSVDAEYPISVPIASTMGSASVPIAPFTTDEVAVIERWYEEQVKIPGIDKTTMRSLTLEVKSGLLPAELSHTTGQVPEVRFRPRNMGPR